MVDAVVLVLVDELVVLVLDDVVDCVVRGNTIGITIMFGPLLLRRFLHLLHLLRFGFSVVVVLLLLHLFALHLDDFLFVTMYVTCFFAKVREPLDFRLNRKGFASAKPLGRANALGLDSASEFGSASDLVDVCI